MKITIYGKSACRKCHAAKDKMERMGLPYAFYDLDNPPSNWRDNGFCVAMAEYCMRNTLPIICIDGNYLDYPQAMKRAKKARNR